MTHTRWDLVFLRGRVFAEGARPLQAAHKIILAGPFKRNSIPTIGCRLNLRVKLCFDMHPPLMETLIKMTLFAEVLRPITEEPPLMCFSSPALLILTPQ